MQPITPPPCSRRRARIEGSLGGNATLAEATLRTSLRLYPRHYASLRLLGALLSSATPLPAHRTRAPRLPMSERWNEGVELLKRAVAANPLLPHAHISLANVPPHLPRSAPAATEPRLIPTFPDSTTSEPSTLLNIAWLGARAGMHVRT